MNTHPYLRAFLAGILVPTLIMPPMLVGLFLVKSILQAPVPIERGLVFPMALVPSLWGLWNMLWQRSHATTHLPVGIHGAFLPFLMLPAGTCIALHAGVLVLGAHSVRWFQALTVPYALIALFFAAALGAYYLVWKYVVGFLNQMLGIA
jgi:hypothetical protein